MRLVTKLLPYNLQNRRDSNKPFGLDVKATKCENFELRHLTFMQVLLLPNLVYIKRPTGIPVFVVGTTLNEIELTSTSSAGPSVTSASESSQLLANKVLNTSDNPQAVVSYNQISLSTQGCKKIGKSFKKACRTRWLSWRKL